jgi:NTE family protein
MSRFSDATMTELSSIRRKLQALSKDPEFVLDREGEQVCDLVLAGGGAKGVSHLGALWAMNVLGIRFKRLAGTSAGAMTASLVAAGFDCDELRDEFMDIDFIRFRDGFWDQKLPRFAKLAAISSSFGMFEGTKLQSWMEEMLVKKDANTFGRLPRGGVGMLSPIDKADGSRLQIMASDITHSCEVMIPRDLPLERYGGLRIEGFPVAAAVRMSISVPFFFTPYKLHNSLIVDGAFATNLPLETFDKEDLDDVRWPTLGINLVSGPSPPQSTKDLYHFGLAIFDTMRYGHSRMSFLNYPTRICRLFEVDTGEVHTLDFDITKGQKERLYLNGATSVLRTLRGDGDSGIRKVWNFEEYIKLRKRWSFPSKGEPYC